MVLVMWNISKWLPTSYDVSLTAVTAGQNTCEPSELSTNPTCFSHCRSLLAHNLKSKHQSSY